MAQTRRNNREQKFRVSISVAGSLRSETDVRKDVRAALAEATEEFSTASPSPGITTRGDAVGGFLGLGATEWQWIISVAGPIAGHLIYKAGEEAVGELGKEGGKQLFTFFKSALRKRSLSVNAVEPVKPSETSRDPQSKSKARKKSGRPAKKLKAAKPASKRSDRKSRRKPR